jgi:hypothetical protein
LEWFHQALYEKFKIVPKRLNVYRSMAKDVSIDCGRKPCIIVGCHSHASIPEMLAVPQNYTSLALIHLPCCVNIPQNYLEKDFVAKTQMKTYVDFNVWSQKRQFYIWRIK